MKCDECKGEFEPSRRGSNQKYCSVTCRMRAYRKRSAQKRNVTDSPAIKPLSVEDSDSNNKRLETEVKQLKEEVIRLTRRIASLQQPHYSMAVMIDKVESHESTRYVARHVNGNEWDQGVSPKEALGALVFGYAISRQVTVESVEFSF